MLSNLGKFSAAIVIAGGAVLLQSEPASASASASMLSAPCTASQEADACTEAQNYWYVDDGVYYCGQYNGVCSTDGVYIYFGISYYDNGTTQCPAILPC